MLGQHFNFMEDSEEFADIEVSQNPLHPAYGCMLAFTFLQEFLFLFLSDKILISIQVQFKFKGHFHMTAVK